VPSQPGLHAVDMIDAAHQGLLDVLWSVGGNFLETLPEPEYVRQALQRVPLRVHQDIFLTTQMLVEPQGMALILPATTRYEMPGGGTETSTERQVYFSPEIPGHRIAEARTEWDVLTDLAARVRPEDAAKIKFAGAQEIRDEIDRWVPNYQGIAALRRAGDSFQW